MSGICGSVTFTPERGGLVETPGGTEDWPEEGDVLGPMLAAGAFRGPDGRGVWRQNGVELGYLALNVTPESVHEPQPLVDREAGLVLVADARIDNRNEVLARLGLGVRQNGSPVGDGAVILAAYRRWGEACARELVGDFAFVIWDERERRLLAARDPMGMRGLHYREERDRLLFATEAEQILAVPEVPAKLFEPAVGAYLAGAWGPSHWSFFQGIAQLAPGHALSATPNGVRTWRYWDIDPEARIRYRRDGEYAEHFRELFSEAVRSRLRSHRPVGIRLSGGTDSGSIAAAAGRIMDQGGPATTSEVRAYSSAFKKLPACDERHISDVLARHCGIPVTGIPGDDAWPVKSLLDPGPYRDDPFTPVYQQLTERTFATARDEGVALLLAGDRGDEMVGDWIYDVPGLVGRGRWRAALREFQAYGGSSRRFARVEMLRPILEALGRESRVRRRIPGWVAEAFATRIGLEDILREIAPSPPVRGTARRGRYGRIFRVGGHRMALWHNRAAARAGISWADPWSDRRLAEFILAIPQDLVNRISEPKRLARRAMGPCMPREVRNGMSKIIPSGLFELGMKEKERDTVRRLISDSRSERLGFMDASEVSRAYEGYLRGEPVRHDIWWPLSLEAWLRRHW